MLATSQDKPGRADTDIGRRMRNMFGEGCSIVTPLVTMEFCFFSLLFFSFFPIIFLFVKNPVTSMIRESKGEGEECARGSACECVSECGCVTCVFVSERVCVAGMASRQTRRYCTNGNLMDTGSIFTE